MSAAVEWLARGVYSTLLRLLMPAYVFRLYRRGKAESLYRERLAERFGVYRAESAGDRSGDASGGVSGDASGDAPSNGSSSKSSDSSRNGSSHTPGEGWLWLHAVSLGETRAAAALIEALRTLRPGLRLLLTHGTATGREAGRALLREGDLQTWLPYDTPGATRRFFVRFRPAVGVLMETEVWPNLLLAAQAAGVPMVLANARLSERSFRRGRRVRAVLRPAIDSVALVLAQSEDDAGRIRASGARTVEVAGNLKYDLTLDAAQLAQGAAWRAMLPVALPNGRQRGVVLAAITREGEEAMLLDAWQRVPHGDALLLIVPRHPQRFDDIAALVEAHGLSLARRGTWQDMPPDGALRAQVWLGDSMREMALYYGAAHVALLGGSFAPLGGHNLIEAAACGCPLVMGPSTFNFDEAAGLSLAAGASLRVGDMGEGVALGIELLRSPDRLRALSANALEFASQHRGAADRMARRIARFLPPLPLVEGGGEGREALRGGGGGGDVNTLTPTLSKGGRE